MDSKKIEELLNKYWNCESSLEEEQQLRDYFRKGDIPQEWNETAGLFRYFDAHKKKELNDVSFDRDVIRKVNSGKTGKVVSLVYNAMRIAAGISVLMSPFGWFGRKSEKQRLRKLSTPMTTPNWLLKKPKKLCR